MVCARDGSESGLVVRGWESSAMFSGNDGVGTNSRSRGVLSMLQLMSLINFTGDADRDFLLFF